MTKKERLVYRRMTVTLAAIGVCYLIGQAWDAYWALVALVPMWCRAAGCALANAAVLARWAR